MKIMNICNCGRDECRIDALKMKLQIIREWAEDRGRDPYDAEYILSVLDAEPSTLGDFAWPKPTSSS